MTAQECRQLHEQNIFWIETNLSKLARTQQVTGARLDQLGQHVHQLTRQVADLVAEARGGLGRELSLRKRGNPRWRPRNKRR